MDKFRLLTYVINDAFPSSAAIPLSLLVPDQNLRTSTYTLSDITRSSGGAICPGKSVRHEKVNRLIAPFGCIQCQYTFPQQGDCQCNSKEIHVG
jgi:hypothetical protein